MRDKPFNEKSPAPTEDSLNAALGPVAVHYQMLDELTQAYQKSWAHWKSSGWMQKVERKKKALYYLIPFDGAFLLSLTIREAEKDSILSNPAHEGFAEIVTAARKDPEGYNVQFEICDAESFAMAKEFVMQIMAQR